MIALDIKSLKNGACMEQFNDAIAQVVRNIIDPNTDARKARTVTLKLTVKPNEDRNMCEISASVTAALCPPKPVTTGATIGYDLDTGETTAFELADSPRPDVVTVHADGMADEADIRNLQ